MTNTPETLFPTRYQLQDKLDEGGMEIVYRATDCLTVSTVASETLLLLAFVLS
ncbi:MAG: hypothetical protein GY805_20500 [Chloroflexi bacterium]|nr:hypothetical protein [Chloroflexota bacterium]